MHHAIHLPTFKEINCDGQKGVGSERVNIGPVEISKFQSRNS